MNRRSAHFICLLSLGLATASCGGSNGDSTASPTPTAPTPTPTPSPAPAPSPSTTFQGTIAGRNGQIGTMNVTIQATVSATSIRPLAVAQATGSVRPAGGISVSLTGTFDDASRDVSVSGGGYTFSGRVGTGGVLAGIYTGPNGLGGAFSSLDSTNSTVTAYCGSAVEERDGTIPFTIQVSSSGTLSGMIFGDPACALTGRATGNTLSVTDCEGRMNTGTIQGGTVSGRTPSGASFSGSTSACQ